MNNRDSHPYALYTYLLEEINARWVPEPADMLPI